MCYLVAALWVSEPTVKGVALPGRSRQRDHRFAVCTRRHGRRIYRTTICIELNGVNDSLKRSVHGKLVGITRRKGYGFILYRPICRIFPLNKCKALHAGPAVRFPKGNGIALGILLSRNNGVDLFPCQVNDTVYIGIFFGNFLVFYRCDIAVVYDGTCGCQVDKVDVCTLFADIIGQCNGGALLNCQTGGRIRNIGTVVFAAALISMTDVHNACRYAPLGTVRQLPAALFDRYSAVALDRDGSIIADRFNCGKLHIGNLHIRFPSTVSWLTLRP